MAKIRLIISLIFIIGEWTQCSSEYFVEIMIKSRPLNYSDIYEYKCHFNVPVECYWRNNNITIGTGPYAYVNFKPQNKSKDCSIRATKSNYTKTFNLQYPELDCLGVVTVSDKQVDAGSSTLLECISLKTINCGWKKKHQTVSIVDRYKYVDGKAATGKVLDCSIVIENATKDDAGAWECATKSTDNTLAKPNDSLAFYNVEIKGGNTSNENYPKFTSIIFYPDNLALTALTESNKKTTTEYSQLSEKASVDGKVTEKLLVLESKVIILIAVLSFVLSTIAVTIPIVVIRRRRQRLKRSKADSLRPPTVISHSNYAMSNRALDNSIYEMGFISGHSTLPKRPTSDVNSETYLVPINNKDIKIYTTLEESSHIYEEIPFNINHIPSYKG